jgi:hypothetical protein
MKKFGISRIWLAVLLLIPVAIPQLSGSAYATPRTGVTLPDDRSGYQIQMVYVETSSAKGSNYDTNGQIARWIAETQTWLRAQIGKELVFDTNQGDLDIAYLKFNGNFTYEGTEQEKLVQMYRKLNPKTYFGKTLVFIIDQVKPVGSDICGWAGTNEDYALIFPNSTFVDGSGCLGYSSITAVNSGFSFAAQTILHEIFHSYGIEDHVCVDTTDLMHGSPECEDVGIKQDFDKPVTFDLSKRFYFGGNRAGVDLMTLKVWSDGSGLRHPELNQGICWKNELCSFGENTFSEQGIVQLQVKIGGKWKVVNSAKGELSNCEDCYKYSFKNTYRFTKAGTYQYRIVKLQTKKYTAYTGKAEIVRVLS